MPPLPLAAILFPGPNLFRPPTSSTLERRRRCLARERPTWLAVDEDLASRISPITSKAGRCFCRTRLLDNLGRFNPIECHDSFSVAASANLESFVSRHYDSPLTFSTRTIQ